MAKATGGKSGARGGATTAQTNVAAASQRQALEAAVTGAWDQENPESAEARGQGGAGSSPTGTSVGREADTTEESREGQPAKGDLSRTGRLRKPSAKAKAAAKTKDGPEDNKAADKDPKQQQQPTPKRRRGRLRKRAGGGGEGSQRRQATGHLSPAGPGDGGGDDDDDDGDDDDGSKEEWDGLGKDNNDDDDNEIVGLPDGIQPGQQDNDVQVLEFVEDNGPDTSGRQGATGSRGLNRQGNGRGSDSGRGGDGEEGKCCRQFGFQGPPG